MSKANKNNKGVSEKETEEPREIKVLAPTFPDKKAKPIKRTFASLIKKHKIADTEAALLKISMSMDLDKNGLIDSEAFDRIRKTIMNAPAGR